MSEDKSLFSAVLRFPHSNQKLAQDAYEVLSSHVVLDEPENLIFEQEELTMIVKMSAQTQKKLRKMIISFMESYESFNEIWFGLDEKE